MRGKRGKKDKWSLGEKYFIKMIMFNNDEISSSSHVFIILISTNGFA